MNEDSIEYSTGGDDGDVSSCCRAPIIEEHDWMHGETRLECSSCRFECTTTPAKAFDE